MIVGSVKIDQQFTPEFTGGEVASRRRKGLAKFSRIEWLFLGAFFGAWAAFLGLTWIF